MITINNTIYTGNKIILTGLYVGDIVTMSSDSGYVTWKIIKNPTTDEYVKATFNESKDSISTMNSENFLLNLIGTYYIKAFERDSNGNYSETNIYIRSNSILTRASLPFSGEKDEINVSGWGDQLLRYVLKLEDLVAPLFIFDVDGGGAVYCGNETTIYGGDSVPEFGFTLDGGNARTQYGEAVDIYGGTINQILTKDSDVDYDYSWKTITQDNILDGSTYVQTHNDFTDLYMNKLSGIEEGADVNIQSNWSETNTESDSYILNKPNNTNAISIPIEFPEDGTIAPSISELYENVNKKVRIRKFSNSTNNDVTFDWTTPHDMDTSQPIQFRVKGIKTEANGVEGSESRTVKFSLAGYSSVDLNSSTQTYGASQVVTKSIGDIGISQHSVFITDWSNDITISNLTINTINQLLFIRDISVVNNYVHDISVIEIEIRYVTR